MAISVIQDALSLLRNGSVAEAIERLEQTVAATPAYAAAYVLLGRAYESQKQWKAARTAWDQAFVLVPHSPTVQEGRSRVRTTLRNRQKEQSEASAQTATEHPPPPSPKADPGPEKATPKEPGTVPRISMDDGPTDLASLRAQTEQATSQPEPSPVESLKKRTPRFDDTDADLDHLISELQSARITPDPDLDDVPTPDLEDDIDDMVSETLARIYASQENYHEAARVYVQLASQEPDRAESLLKQASQMRMKAKSKEEEGEE